MSGELVLATAPLAEEHARLSAKLEECFADKEWLMGAVRERLEEAENAE